VKIMMRLALLVLLLLSLGCQGSPREDQRESPVEEQAETAADEETDDAPLSERIRRASPRRYIK